MRENPILFDSGATRLGSQVGFMFDIKFFTAPSLRRRNQKFSANVRIHLLLESLALSGTQVKIKGIYWSILGQNAPSSLCSLSLGRAVIAILVLLRKSISILPRVSSFKGDCILREGLADGAPHGHHPPLKTSGQANLVPLNDFTEQFY